ncbi:MAG: ribbon-helix-helix protein, CopG family [Armatimonadetes bacterium]|nr:ribbon-helix-helix protein, CopG family [Armatimonadota bacterium]
MERVMVTLPRDLLQEVDAAAGELKQNRSELVRRALREMLRQIRERRFEELLAEGYRESAARAAVVGSEGLPLQAAATEGTWHWDE